MSKSLNIVIACGGTGGHLFPGIAVGEALRAHGHELLLLISEKDVDAAASAKYAHLRFGKVSAVAKPATFSLRMPGFLWMTWQSVGRCRAILRDFGADAVLGMGGFTSLPPVYAGHKMGLKTFIHDSNARPGRANVLTSRFCTRVFLGMEAARGFFPRRETAVTGTPVRPEMLALPDREQAAAVFGLDPAMTTVLITGGSQGASRLNEWCAEAAEKLPEHTQLLHIAGARDFDNVSGLAKDRPRHKVLGFCDHMAMAYAVADLVIARAGASSLAEIAICGCPSILVPYPYAADDHQTCNAEVFVRAGAAMMVQERDLDAGKLAGMAAAILDDLPTRDQMAKAARALAVPDAAERVCNAIESAIHSP